MTDVFQGRSLPSHIENAASVHSLARRNSTLAHSESALNLPAVHNGHDHGLCSSVCLVTDSEEPSGVGEHILALIAVLRHHRRVVLACSSAPKVRRFLERTIALGIDTLAFDWHSSDWPRRFAGWLTHRNVVLCHVHAGIFWEAQDIAVIAKHCGVPVVVRTEHLPFVSDDPGHRTQHAKAMRYVDQLICVSNQARDSFVDAGIAPERIAVIRNGARVIAGPADRTAFRSTLGFDPDSRIVLTVARYTEQKDHRTLLDAIPTVLEREPRARFLWVGTGPLEEVMIDTVRRQGLDRYVMFLGQRDDVPELLAAADVFALPSRFEGLPLAVLEAMAAGLPVVATRVCGTTEAVRHRLTGLLVDPSQPTALATALVEVLTKPEWAEQLGERGRVRAGRCFSAERMTRQTLALYDNVLSRSRTAMPARERVNNRTVQSSRVAR